MPKYVPRLEGIIHDPKGNALCLLTLGHISAYNMDNTILFSLLLFFHVDAVVCQNNGQFQVWELNI
jgi:hypothetical protein